MLSHIWGFQRSPREQLNPPVIPNHNKEKPELCCFNYVRELLTEHPCWSGNSMAKSLEFILLRQNLAVYEQLESKFTQKLFSS